MPGATDGHFKFVATLLERAKKAGKSVSSLFLQYDLAPGGQYPRQLTQAVETLRYCVETLPKSPSQIMLLGDSSGANLIIGILSHLMHPHPEIKPLPLSIPLKAAMASSPVCILTTDNPLFVSQEAQDPASAGTIKTWMSDYLGSRKPDAWNEPLQNSASWWSSLDKVVKEVLITVAEVEMMAGDTLACTEKMKVRLPLPRYSLQN
jgi:acetyl esterase/lipase